MTDFIKKNPQLIRQKSVRQKDLIVYCICYVIIFRTCVVLIIFHSSIIFFSKIIWFLFSFHSNLKFKNNLKIELGAMAGNGNQTTDRQSVI